MDVNKKILEMKEEIIQSLKECIKIRSVENRGEGGTPFGLGIQEALNYCLNLSEDFGFKTVNLDDKIGYAEYGKGDEMVAVLGHLDVVPEGKGWKYPPYEGEIHDGKMYGRGTTDDKGPTIGALYALKIIKDLNIPIKKRVRVIFGLNEETSSECVKHYIEKKEELPVAGFTPDAEYPIINGEKGIVTCEYKKNLNQDEKIILKSIKGGTAPNVVPEYADAEILVLDAETDNIIDMSKEIKEIEIDKISDNMILVKSYGISAHGSTPEIGKNAISHLLLFLQKLNFNKDVKEFVNFMNKYIGTDTTGESMDIYLEDDISGKFVLNLGKIQGNEKEISISINMRYPVTKNYEDFNFIFREKMKLGDFKEVYTKHKKSLYVSPQSELIKKLQKVYEEQMGEKADLISIGGGTYAKSMPNIVAFGPIFKGEPMVEHKPNEYIDINGLLKNIEIMVCAICELAN
ncbi:dipeptidase PepV [Romboutsia maritimum]|uniref:Dipeptidase PepV n=1 Tax=Romboutsia maritimum TaxID=2020948 RepID=A0A371ITJ3_9FIRM|nr:dipeptidase PepV [Romboutsia maritimum]RDY23804.1 dipeptidase PepV [Romboutsia maritimum]